MPEVVILVDTSSLVTEVKHHFFKPIFVSLGSLKNQDSCVFKPFWLIEEPLFTSD